jgi:pyruvate/2-oxoglutarate/acetoin dehydrogenase E1 component
MKKITYIDAMNEALYEEMEQDPNVFIIGEDINIDGGVWNEASGFMVDQDLLIDGGYAIM